MKIKLRPALFLILVFSSIRLFAQAPVIQNFSPASTFSNDTIVVTGTGFSASAANLEVWFGTVKGTIITSSEFAIEVKVPAQATLNTIEVINLATRLSAKSRLKFQPSLKTETFSAANFAAQLEFQEQQELWDLCLCDLNTDGKPDIAATKFARPTSPYLISQDIMILQNQSTPGALSFTKFDKTNLAAVNLGYATDNIVCGDLNGDGKPELVASRGIDPRNSIIIFRNTTSAGSMSFATPSAGTGTILFLENNHSATRMFLKDLNKDGKPEIIVTASTTDIFYIYLNQSSSGNLAFNTTPIKLDIDPSGTSLRTYEPDVQDFDNDGLPDIIVNRFQDNNFYIFRNQSTSSISFAAPVELATPAERDFNRIASADFNNDGKLDLVLTNSTVISQISAIYINQSTAGNISFTPDASAIKFTTSQGAWGIDVSDIDGDKDPDMLIAAKDVNELNVFTHNGNFSTPGFTKFNIPTASPNAWNPRNIKVGDLDGDAKPDIVFIGQNDALGRAAVGILRNTHCHQPEILNEEPLTICTGQSIVLKTAQANNVTFTWQKDGSPIGTNSPFLTINAAGTYRVTATNGACSLFDEITVSFNAGATPADPEITANTPLCVGSTLNLSSSDVPGATYTWTRPTGTTLTGKDQSFTAALSDAGVYELQVNIGVCKSKVVTKRVDVATLANFSISSVPASAVACQGNTVQLSVSNVSNHTYQWEKDGVDVPSGGTSNTFAAGLDGSYTVRVRNTVLNCETETSAVAVTILTPPVANYSVDASACTGEQIAFTNTSTKDSRAIVVYQWSFGDATSSSIENPTKSYTTAQTFNTSLTVSYSGVSACTANTSKSITVVAAVLPVINSTAETLCPEGEATLSVSGSFASITWSNSTTGASTTVVGPATYSVQTADGNGCVGNDNIVITAKPAPTLTATATPSQVIPGSETQLQVTASPEVEGIQYLWSPTETLNNPSIPNPIASPTQTTTYTVTACGGSAQIEVRVDGSLGFPAAFSPNNDGVADVWDIRAQDNLECSLSIFDSRGRRILESKGENWDGTYQGKPVPAGTYYYVFDCPDKKPVTGTVLIMR